jgi:mannose/fructose/N-acetylgalactosamine-specific phosphotransferase system component IID
VVSLPVAYDCLLAFGIQTYQPRVTAHALLGCAVYGALVVKVFAVRSRSAPGWFLPVAGGVLFALFMAVVLTSAVWYSVEYGFPTGHGY